MEEEKEEEEEEEGKEEPSVALSSCPCCILGARMVLVQNKTKSRPGDCSGGAGVVCIVVFFKILQTPRSTQSKSSAAADVKKRQISTRATTSHIGR